jgi:hypothetical protein
MLSAANLCMHGESKWKWQLQAAHKRLRLMEREQQQQLLGPPPPAPAPAVLVVDEDAISRMYVFLYQGLWVEQLHHRVVAAYQEAGGGSALPDTDALEDAVEQDRATTWVLSAKSKRREEQRATMAAMLTKGAPDRGILGFLWRHPECRAPGVIAQAVQHHRYSATFGRIMEQGWLEAFAAWPEPEEPLSEEEEHEGVLGL